MAEQEIKQQKEKRLVVQLKENYYAAFEQLVRDYSDKMYTICCRYFLCKDDAQECLQNAFIQIFLLTISRITKRFGLKLNNISLSTG